MLRTVIIDDDKIAICVLVNLLSKLTSFDVKVVGIANNLEDGVDLIKKNHPDFIFLDISMPGKNGMDIFKEFQFPQFKIIFYTSFSQYAIEAFKRSACGYLIKPVDFIDLQETLQKVNKELLHEQRQLQLEDTINILSTPEIAGVNIMLDVENGFIMCNTRNIEYCYASQSYTGVVTSAKSEILVSKSLKEIQELLPINQFYRTHKSFLVNIYYIRKFVRAKESYVLLKSGIKIPVSVRITFDITKDITKILMV